MMIAPVTRRAGLNAGRSAFLNAFSLAKDRCSSRYDTGTTTSVRSVDVSRPPIVAIEIGARNSPPSPRPKADGTIPRIIASVVITIGRSRTGPAFRRASITDRPSSRCSWFV